MVLESSNLHVRKCTIYSMRPPATLRSCFSVGIITLFLSLYVPMAAMKTAKQGICREDKLQERERRGQYPGAGR